MSKELKKQEKINSVPSLTDNRSIAEVKKGTQLSTLNKSGVGVKAVGVLVLQVSELMGMDLSSESIKLVSNMIASNYWNMKIDEIAYICRKGVSGDYGKNFGKFSYSMFGEWVKGYQEESADYLEQHHASLKHTPESEYKAFYEAFARETGIEPRQIPQSLREAFNQPDFKKKFKQYQLEQLKK
jgi:hypothetical protein